MAWDDKTFFRAMEALAQQGNAQINQFTLETYEQALRPYGMEKFVDAARKLMMSGVRRFPSIVDFKQAMGVPTEEPLTHEEKAKVIVKSIEGAIRSAGYTQPDRAKAMIGAVGWEAIRMSGGWEKLCDVKESELTYTMNSYIAVVTALLKNPTAVDSLKSQPLNPALPDAARKLLGESFSLTRKT